MQAPTCKSGYEYTSQDTPTSNTTAYTEDSKYPSNVNIVIPHDHWIDFPETVQHAIIQHLPRLASYLCVSRSFNNAVKNYASLRGKKFKELKDEASTWGHRSTPLHQILFIEPLIVQNIISIVYDPLLNNSRPHGSDIQDSLPVLQKIIFKAFETALDNYDHCWTSIVPLLDICQKYRLHYIKYLPSDQNSEASTQTEITSLDSLVPSSKIYEQCIDETFERWTERLCLLASKNGHVSNYPKNFCIPKRSVVELNERSMRLFIKVKCARGVFKLLENARILGQFFELMLIGLNVCLKLSRVHDAKESLRKISELLLGYVFNDTQGPYRRNLEGTQSNDIILKAAELKDCIGIDLYYCSRAERFILMHEKEALVRRLDFCRLE